MACLNCGAPQTCRAHILPKAAALDIRRGAGRPNLDVLTELPVRKTSNAVYFDENLLCSDCDGVLGAWDDHAVSISKLLGTEHETVNEGNFVIRCPWPVQREKLARFGAAVVWRTSASRTMREMATPQKPPFSLGSNQEWMKCLAFGTTSEVPKVVVCRLGSTNPAADQNARRTIITPERFRYQGSWAARFAISGLLFFVSTSQSGTWAYAGNEVTAGGTSTDATAPIGQVMPLEHLYGYENRVEMFLKRRRQDSR